MVAKKPCGLEEWLETMQARMIRGVEMPIADATNDFPVSDLLLCCGEVYH